MTKLLIDDAGTEQLIEKHFVDTGEETRRYYAAKDGRAIVVLRHGLTLKAVRGRVTDAALGWDEGNYPAFVHPHNKGKRHSKATLHRVLDGATQDLTLSDFLNNSPKGND